MLRGYLVTKSVVGQAMASQERIVGNHPVCLAFLDLLAVVSEVKTLVFILASFRKTWKL